MSLHKIILQLKMIKTKLLLSNNLIKNVSLSKTVTWYGIGNIFIRTLSFAILPLYSNLITTAEFGNYALLMSIYSIVAVIFQFGTQSVLNKFYIEESDEEKRKIIFSSILNSLVILGLALTFILLFTSTTISVLIFGTSSFSSLLLLVYSAIFFDSLGVYVLSLLKTKEMAKKTVYFSLIGAVSNFIFNIIFVYLLKLSVAGILLAQLASCVLLLFTLFGTIKKEYVFKINHKVFNAVLLFSLPLVASNLFGAGVNFGDRFILNYYLGREEVGLYSFAYRIAMIMNVFVLSFSTAWTPRSIIQYYKNDYKDYYGKILTKLVAISCILLLSVSVLAQYLFKIHISNISLFNPIYSSGIIILPFVLMGYAFSAISAFYSVYPFISNKSFHFLIADFIALVSNISINLILIPKFGIIGAAIATTIAFLLGAAYLFIISRNKIQINYQVKELFFIILIAVVFLLLGLMISNIFAHLTLIIMYFIILHYVIKIKLI
jgi:O-antigen/teichoic acid export membrane protein